MTTAAIIAVVALAGVTLFQVCLAAGAPWGRASWGGQHSGVLPKRLRIASGIAALAVYPLLIAYVVSSAGLVDRPALPGAGARAMWATSGLFLLGTLMNAVSRSPVERWWALVTLLIAGCCAVVASGA
jgi:hypothetical protein